MTQFQTTQVFPQWWILIKFTLDNSSEVYTRKRHKRNRFLEPAEKQSDVQTEYLEDESIQIQFTSVNQ